jgi:hypothetical protein
MDKDFVVKTLKIGFLTGLCAFILVSCVDMNMQNQNNWQNQNVFEHSPAIPGMPVQASIVSNEHVTLTNLNMNNQGNQIIIKPGKTVEASIHYSYHCPNCYQSLNNQIIIGLANRSAQACIYDGGREGKGSAAFTLKVPAKPGQYDVRFRALQAPDCSSALKAGWNADNSPAKDTTLGTIRVSRKAEEK